jgi:hypothetical protein
MTSRLPRSTPRWSVDHREAFGEPGRLQAPEARRPSQTGYQYQRRPEALVSKYTSPPGMGANRTVV